MNITLTKNELPHFSVPHSMDQRLKLSGTEIGKSHNVYGRMYTVYVSAHVANDGRLVPYMYSEGYKSPKGWSIIRNKKELKEFYESL